MSEPEPATVNQDEQLQGPFVEWTGNDGLPWRASYLGASREVWIERFENSPHHEEREPAWRYYATVHWAHVVVALMRVDPRLAADFAGWPPSSDDGA